jgi:hypothetical protein
MPPLLAQGLEHYWNSLMPLSTDGQDELCNRLAHASVVGFRDAPIYASWLQFQGDGSGESITNIFSRFNWKI